MRLFDAIGRPELKDDPRFRTNTDRLEHADVLDAIIAEWMSHHTREEALATFEEHDAALAPIYDVSEFMDDPHVRARGSIETVDDPEWGAVRMQGIHPRMSRTPGEIRTTGPSGMGAHNDEVYGELGIDATERDRLTREGTI
jgi:formyl-CoA transferase